MGESPCNYHYSEKQFILKLLSSHKKVPLSMCKQEKIRCPFPLIKPMNPGNLQSEN